MLSYILKFFTNLDADAVAAIREQLDDLFIAITSTDLSPEQIEQLLDEKSSCGVKSILKCTAKITRAVAKCTIGGKVSLACIKKVIGAANKCYPCICKVLKKIGIKVPGC